MGKGFSARGKRMCKGPGLREAQQVKGLQVTGMPGARTRGKQGGTAGVQREMSAGPAYSGSRKSH